MLGSLRSKSRQHKTQELEKLEELQSRAAARINRISHVVEQRKIEETGDDPFELRTFERKAVDFPAMVVCEIEGDMCAQIVDLSETGLRVRFEIEHYPEETVVIDSEAFAGFIVADTVWQDGREAGFEINQEWTDRLANAENNPD